jgi:hypothetical protein
MDIPIERRLTNALALHPPAGEWRAVPTYEGLYEVSSEGEVRRLPAIVTSKSGRRRLFPGGILHRVKDRNGYLMVTLSRNASRERVSVHVIVVWAFIGIRSSLQRPINHIDGDKHNCRLENLELTTPKGNSAHAFATGLSKPGGVAILPPKLTYEDIAAIRALHHKVRGAYLAERFGVHRKYIYAIQNGKARVRH